MTTTIPGYADSSSPSALTKGMRSSLCVAVVALLLGACGSGDDAETSPATLQSEAPPESTQPDVAPVSATGREVGDETLAYAEVDEQLVYGHFSFPTDMIEPLPAVVVIHDWWGLNDNVRESANRLAAEGYMVLAVDLYGGEVATDTASARARMIKVLEDPDAVEENLRQALRFVGNVGAPSKAALGWGLGGSWSLNSAILFPDDIDAAVIFYGQPSADEDQLAGLDAPLLAFYGARDRGIKIESVRTFESTMQRLQKSLQLEVYDDTGHAFADPARQNYRAEEAADAWQKSVQFLSTNMTVGDVN